MAIDPIQGLIDYVTEVKPFHTKILEVAVAYSHNDDVDITITEDLQLDLALFWPAIAGSPESEGPIRICSAGYGVEYDRSTPYIVVDANISPQTFSLEGDQTGAFVVGTRFEIREPYTSAAYASPQTENTPRLVIGIATSVTYDTTTDTTVIGATFISEDWIGSPRTTLTGSPAIGSPVVGSPVNNEFWLPPYGGNDSGGDVFVIYDVVATNTLNLTGVRPIVWYGSPITLGASPYTPIWPPVNGSPLPGSPKLVTGSPLIYPTFGSPTVHGNTITIKSTTPDVFLYGQEIEIRNASDPDINRQYNILRARDLGGSPNLVELTVLDRILADTTNDGELLFTPDGFSGGDICGDVPPEILQIHWLEDLDISWRFGDGSPNQLLQPGFQHFILSADSTSNTITVQGDVRYILTEFTGSPVSVGSPNISASIQHARSAYGSPFWIGSPYVDLNANNGPVIIQNVVYNASLNESTLTLNSVAVSNPTGWIVSTYTPPTPPLEFTALAIADVTFSLSSPLIKTPQFIWGSSSDVTTWTPTVSFDPLPGKNKTGGALATDGLSLGNIYDIGYDGSGRWVAVGDPSVGGVWGSPQFGSTSNVDGTILTSDDNGVTWVRRTPAAPNTGSPRPLEPFYGVAYNGTIWVAVSFDADSVSTLSEIWTSTDNAVTWSRGYSTTSQNLNDIEWTGDEFVIVGDNHTLLTSPDGLTWTEVQPGSPLPFDFSTTDYTSFEINASGSPTRWFVGTSTSGSPIFSGNIWYSDNKGVTWNRGVGVGSPGSETGFSATIYDIAVNPNNNTVIGVGLTPGRGVFVSNDNGLTWQTVSEQGPGSPSRDPYFYCAEYDSTYGFLIGGSESWWFKPYLMSGGQDGLTWTTRIGVGIPSFEETWGSPGLASATIQAIGVK